MIGKQHLVYQFFRPCVPPPCTGAPETTYVQHQCNVQWQILSADGVGKLCTTCTLCAAHLEHLVYSTNAMYSGKSCQQTMLENYEQHALFVQHTLLCVQCLCTLASCVSRPCWKSKQLCRLWEILGRVNTRKLSEKEKYKSLQLFTFRHKQEEHRAVEEGDHDQAGEVGTMMIKLGRWGEEEVT